MFEAAAYANKQASSVVYSPTKHSVSLPIRFVEHTWRTCL